MPHFKKIAAGTLLCFALLVPTVSHAQTTTSTDALRAQIAVLIQLIAQLQAQLNAQTGGTTTIPTAIPLPGTTSASFSVVPSSGNAPLAVQVTAPAALGGYGISYGDGAASTCTYYPTYTQGASSCDISGSHTYTNPGIYGLQVTKKPPVNGQPIPGDTVGFSTIVVNNNGVAPDSKGGCVVLTRTLAYGMSDGSLSGDITKLQTYLVSLGYNTGGITGYYDYNTQSAVMAWQWRNHIVMSGTPATTGFGSVGPATRIAMSRGCQSADGISSPTLQNPGVSGKTATVNYINLPIHTYINALWQNSNGDYEQVGQVQTPNGGTGVATITLPDNAPQGTYKMRANKTDDANWSLDSSTFVYGSSNPSLTCHVTASPAQAHAGDSVTLTWSSLGANTASWIQDSGANVLGLPSGSFLPDGSKTILMPTTNAASVVASLQVMRTASGGLGATTGSCAATIGNLNANTSSGSATVDSSVFSQASNTFAVTGTAGGSAIYDGVITFLIPATYSSASDYYTLLGQLGKDGIYENNGGGMKTSGVFVAQFPYVNNGSYRVIVFDASTKALLTSPDRPLTVSTASNIPPTCTITLDKSSYVLGDTIRLSWSSQNATSARWVPDTSGKDNFVMPSGTLASSGYQTITANVLGNPFVTLAVTGTGGTATCKLVIPVSSAPSTGVESAAFDSGSLFATTGTPTITGSASNVSIVNLYVNGGAIGSATVVNGRWSVTIGALWSLASGAYSLQLRDANNSVLTTGTLLIKVAPVASATIDPTSLSAPADTSFVISGSASGVQSVQVSAGIAGTNYFRSAVLPVTNGRWQVRVVMGLDAGTYSVGVIGYTDAAGTQPAQNVGEGGLLTGGTLAIGTTPAKVLGASTASLQQQIADLQAAINALKLKYGLH